MDIKSVLNRVPGVTWHWSALQSNHESIFRYFLKKAQPKVALELGTFQGVSTALIAEYAERVITIDVLEYPIQEQVWAELGVRGKIESYVVKSSALKEQIVNSCAFDFAFVDGSHLYESVAFDFSLVKKCGNVLFHDYWLDGAHNWPDVKKFVDEFCPGAEIKVPFAYWRQP